MATTRDVFPVVVMIPSLNPDEKIIKTVSGILAQGFTDVLIIDDGSRESCQKYFDELELLDGCTVLHHPTNQGKGRALKTAFSYYLENFDLNEYVGVVTADADGQHLPKDIYSTALLLNCPRGGSCTQHKNRRLVLGTRDFTQENVPFKSRNGNQITTVVFKLLYGKHINDTQTGLRGISNDFIKDCLDITGERFEYEINMLIEAVNLKTEIKEQTIETVYFDDNRETHFRPFADSFKIYRVMLSSLLRFACSGGISLIVDQGLFALLQRVVLAGFTASTSIPAATVISRATSSIVNFTLNRTVVFKKKTNKREFFFRYYAICIAQMLLSAAGVTVVYMLTRWNTTIIKLFVDTILFLMSYWVQRIWVFKEVD